jgi:hypothetical protein
MDIYSSILICILFRKVELRNQQNQSSIYKWTADQDRIWKFDEVFYVYRYDLSKSFYNSKIGL